MSDTARLSAKDQISIPNAVREAQRWPAGQELVFVPKGTGVLVLPVPRIEDPRGLAECAKPETDRDRADRV